MKRMYTAFVALLLTFTAYQYSNAQTLTGPVFDAASDEVSYGTIKKDSDRVRVLSFKNTGTEPLLITNATGSCGCTVPEWPKDPVMPGASAEIKINYDTARIGPINKTVFITTNEVESTDAAGNPIYKQHSVKVTGTVTE